MPFLNSGIREVSNGIDSLQTLIRTRSLEFYLEDRDCPIDWEPGGYDFLSPCLEEIDLMRRILPENEFRDWINGFAPQLESIGFSLDIEKLLSLGYSTIWEATPSNTGPIWTFTSRFGTSL